MNHNLSVCDGCEEVVLPGETTEVGHKDLCELCVSDFEEGIDGLYSRLAMLIGVEE